MGLGLRRGSGHGCGYEFALGLQPVVEVVAGDGAAVEKDLMSTDGDVLVGGKADSDGGR